MKKRILSVLLCVAVLFSVCAIAVNAGNKTPIGAEILEDIVTEIRVCPGAVLTDKIKAPAVAGPVFAQGWEITNADGDWIPYTGEPIKEADNGKKIRYFVADELGGYAYSNECELRAAHNPSGDYHSTSLYHWRDCTDCGGKAGYERHDFLLHESTSENNICSVCGATRFSSPTGLLVFWEWLMDLIVSLIS
ncbi:MAG: hypothetical protein ACI4IF_02805 [Acutalibacteraceae bacterium]